MVLGVGDISLMGVEDKALWILLVAWKLLGIWLNFLSVYGTFEAISLIPFSIVIAYLTK